ncbi:MAG: IS110 family transposase, partial [Kordia sp.]
MDKKAGIPQVNLTIVMEVTGVYHEAIAYYLYDKDYQVSIMQSRRVKKYTQSLDQRSKTDALDSKMLSMLGCERKLTPWEPP